MNLPSALIGALLLIGSPLLADEPADYRALAERVRGGDLLVDFSALRHACVRSRDCDPEGDRDKLMAARRAMQAKEYDKAIAAGEALLDAGYVNIEAHAICSQAYTELGKPDKARFHHDVTTALIHSVLSKGDGKTQGTAYEVISIAEEYVIVQVLGLPRLGGQALIGDGKGHNFDRLERMDPKTSEKVDVYFNIDAFFPSRYR